MPWLKLTAVCATLAAPLALGASVAADTFTCHGETATYVGTPGRDRINLFGSSDRDVVVALGGDNYVATHGGPDIVCGGQGADEVTGGGGNDRLFGEAGNDLLRGH